MLALLSAIVPISASLYVAGSMLVEYAQRDHIARVAERVWARDRAERAALDETTGSAIGSSMRSGLDG